MTSIAPGLPDPFALDDPRVYKMTTSQFDNQRYIHHSHKASATINKQAKRRSMVAAPPKSGTVVASLTSTVASTSTPSLRSSGSSSSLEDQQPKIAKSRPRPNASRTATSPSRNSVATGSATLTPSSPPMMAADKLNSKMHQTSSKILRMTDDDRPFTKDFKDLFSTLITSLPLNAHRVRFTKVEETFLSEEAITNLGSLKFSQSNRIPDPKNPSRWVVTTTTTTFSMAREMARSVCQRFVDARLIESAEQKMYPQFPLKGAVWQMTPKGTAVLKRFCDRNGIEARHIEPLIRRPQMQMVDLERDTETDKLIQDKTTIEVIFRRFAGQEGPNLKNSLQVADSDSISEYSTGLVGVKMARDRRVGDRNYQHTFTGKAASDWLLDCCTTIDRRETYEICELFAKAQLIATVVEDKAYSKSVPGSSLFQPTKHSIYTVTERGQRVCGWLSRPPSMSSDDSRAEKHRMPKDTNCNRLKAILADPALRMLFKEHLKASLCEENLNFYLDAEDFISTYRNLEQPGISPRPESVRETLATAYGLYNSFLASGAPSELNIDHSLRNKLDSRMTQTESDKQSMPSTLESVVELIETASISVFKLMASDSVPKFIRDPKYQPVLRDHEFDIGGHSRAFSPPPSGSEGSMSRSNTVRRKDSS